MHTALPGQKAAACTRALAPVARTQMLPVPAAQRHSKLAIRVRAGPGQASSTQERTEFPDLPRGPDDMTPDWFLDLYKSDKTLVPWDTGKEQSLVVKAFESGLFTAPVLDVGCGYGTNAIFFGSKGVEATGIDLSPEAIAEAERRRDAAGSPAADKVDFVAGSVTELPQVFGERKFGSALDSALYHCLDDATNEQYLAALHKQMVPGGRLVLAAMSDANPAEGWIGPRRISEADLRHSLREEAGWRLENISEDKYEIPPKAAEMAPQFARGYGIAVVATATRI